MELVEVAGPVDPAGLVEKAGQEVLEDIRKAEMEEGGGILDLEADTILEGRHMASQDIQDQADQEGRHGPSQQEEGRMVDIAMAGQREVHQEDRLEVGVLAVEVLGVLVLVGFDPEPFLELVLGGGNRSVQNMQSAIDSTNRS